MIKCSTAHFSRVSCNHVAGLCFICKNWLQPRVGYLWLWLVPGIGQYHEEIPYAKVSWQKCHPLIHVREEREQGHWGNVDFSGSLPSAVHVSDQTLPLVSHHPSDSEFRPCYWWLTAQKFSYIDPLFTTLPSGIQEDNLLSSRELYWGSCLWKQTLLFWGGTEGRKRGDLLGIAGSPDVFTASSNPQDDCKDFTYDRRWSPVLKVGATEDQSPNRLLPYGI